MGRPSSSSSESYCGIGGGGAVKRAAVAKDFLVVLEREVLQVLRYRLFKTSKYQNNTMKMLGNRGNEIEGIARSFQIIKYENKMMKMSEGKYYKK